MASINYSNPSSLLPSQDLWKQGPLGGLQYYDASQDYRKSMDMSHGLQNLELMHKGAEYQDYLAEGPVRESLRGLNVAKNTAQRPIQGDIADALGATARATSVTEPSNAQATVFKNAEHKRAAIEERTSNHLAALLQQHGQNPMAAQDIWRNQIVPQLERESGEKMPDQFKTMDINQMKLFSSALTQNSAHRRESLLQGQKDSGAMDRTLADWMGRVEAARLKGDHTTAAEARVHQMNQYVNALVNKGMRANPNADPVALQLDAKIKAAELFFGGNPYGRADAGATITELGKNRAKIDFVEKLGAQLMPKDPRDRQLGTAYKLPDGRYVRWTPQGAMLLTE